jgi:hypothetical protein
MKNTLHTGFNLTAFFLVFFVGLSHVLLNVFHGTEYLIAHIPFIILSVAVSILGVEFLICTLLIGLGEGKKAATLIAFLTIVQLTLVPTLIIVFKNVFGPLSPVTLYSGPVSLLVSGVAVFPFAYRYLKQYTNNPPRVYSSILAKGAVSIALTLFCYGILDLTVFPNNDPIMGLVGRAGILFGLFTIFMLVFAGYNDKDLEAYEIGPLRYVAKGMKWLLHHSPFYKKEEGDALSGVRE